MKILDAAIQIALLLIAFWSVGQITLSIFAFVNLDLPTEANPFVFLAKCRSTYSLEAPTNADTGVEP